MDRDNGNAGASPGPERRERERRAGRTELRRGTRLTVSEYFVGVSEDAVENAAGTTTAADATRRGTSQPAL